MKAYYNQKNISSSLAKFFKNIFLLSKPHIKSLSFIITAMISAESVVSSDISRKLKDDFSFVLLESNQRRIWRFFYSFSSIAYSFYEALISYIISRFKVKHFDSKVHISFDHMFVKNKFTILLFSLRIGKQGIPLWFRCFKGKNDSDAFSTSLIIQGISFCANLFNPSKHHIIFLADRWFPSVPILSHIQNINCFYCLRAKSDYTYSFYDFRGFFHTKYIRDIIPLKHKAKVLSDVFYTKHLFKTTIVVSHEDDSEPCYLITNDAPNRAIKNYKCRFGSIECIFKSQKSNGFRLESTNTQKIEHFISLFTVMSIALVWLTIIGVDYVKNKHHYKLKIRDVRKHKDNTTTRLYSFFNLGLTIFNLCYYNTVDFTLKFDFMLYDV